MKLKKMSIRPLNQNIQNIRLRITKNVKNVSNSHYTLYIRNFLSFENVEISMQVSNRQLFYRNDVETMFFRGTTILTECIYIYNNSFIRS